MTLTRTRSTARLAVLPFALCLAGLGVSAYLTVEHYTATTSLVCPETSVLNCQKVTTSSWSMIGPAPVALLGLLFFAGMAVICSPWLWELRGLAQVRIAGAAAGVAFALYLVWGEFRLHAICLWCTAAHVTALALLSLLLWMHTAPGNGDR